jgi:hypothetical protein
MQSPESGVKRRGGGAMNEREKLVTDTLQKAGLGFLIGGFSR